MAKGDSVPYETREEVSVKAREHYSHLENIREINPSFNTDKFPHKGTLTVWFNGSSYPNHADFVYEFNNSSERILRITSDWND